MRIILIIGVIILNFKIAYSADFFLPDYHFNYISTRNGLPTNEVNQVYQDKSGYIWFATNSGLCQYDGYVIRTFKSNLSTPGVLNNNIIYGVQEDHMNRLWIGTYNGLNFLDKRTGKIKKVISENFTEKVISELLVTSQNKILIATEGGVYQYDPEKNIFTSIFPEELKDCSVKALIEDSRGNIWIGTWAEGLYRYDPSQEKIYRYPLFRVC